MILPAFGAALRKETAMRKKLATLLLAPMVLAATSAASGADVAVEQPNQGVAACRTCCEADAAVGIRHVLYDGLAQRPRFPKGPGRNSV